MKPKIKSPTYTKLLEMLIILKAQSISDSSVYTSNVTNNKYERTRVDSVVTTRIHQDVFIADPTIYDDCSMVECYILCKIQSQLRAYNCLWYCDPKLKNNSSNNKAIKRLVEKDILWRTETTNIYVVNPKYIRRGDPFAVLTSTLNMLKDEGKVDVEHITDKKALRSYIIPETLLLN